MRMSRTAGLLVSTAVCGTLALGTASPAIAAVHEHPGTAGAAALTTQPKLPVDDDGFLSGVTGLLTAVLKSSEGRLSQEDADELTELTELIESFEEAMGGPTKQAPAAKAADDEPRAEEAEEAEDLKDEIQALLEAVMKGDAKATATAIKDLITDSMDTMADTLRSDDFPAPGFKNSGTQSLW
jgi:hypothetical protein